MGLFSKLFGAAPEPPSLHLVLDKALDPLAHHDGGLWLRRVQANVLATLSDDEQPVFIMPCIKSESVGRGAMVTNRRIVALSKKGEAQKDFLLSEVGSVEEPVAGAPLPGVMVITRDGLFHRRRGDNLNFLGYTMYFSFITREEEERFLEVLRASTDVE